MKRFFGLSALLAAAGLQPIYAVNQPTTLVNPQIVGLQAPVQNVNQNMSTFTLGESAQGGIIFYLDPSLQHGLAAATIDQSTSAAWDSSSSPVITGAAANGLFTGKQLTATILSVITPSTNAEAATSCTGFTGGGFIDWYLPATEELNLLYMNRSLIGEFSPSIYWSSTEQATSDTTATTADSVDFSTGLTNKPMSQLKTTPLHVRCIRSF